MSVVESLPVRWRAWPPLGAGGDAILLDETGTRLLSGTPVELVESLVELLNAGAEETAFEDIFLASGATVLLARWLDAFVLMASVGRLAPYVADSEGDLVALRANAPAAGAPRIAALPPVLRLSRFAVCRAEEGELVLESPRATFSAVLGSRVSTVLPDLAQGSLARSSVVDPLLVSALGLLLDVKLIQDAADTSEHAGTLALWESHDLLFHWRTRRGGHRRTNGATFPHRDRRPPLPTTAEWDHSSLVALDPVHVSDGPSLWSVLSDRTSMRTSSGLIDLAVLGQFLWWHRIVRDVPMDDQHGIEYPQSRRTYPGGGATYELDLFLATRAVEGLEDGLWRYDAHAHALGLISAEAAVRDELFADAEISTGGHGTPQVLITYGLRIGRNSWKYEGMAYRLSLMNAGVLYHHAYLVAGALGIGVCGLGNGDAPLFERAIARSDGDYVSVAELMLVGMR